MIWGWLHRHPRAIDFALVALLLALGIGAALHRHHLRAAAVPLAVCEALPLLYRRRHPGAVVVLVTAVALTSIALDVWAIPLPLGVALYTLMAVRTDRVARAIGVASIVSVAIAVLSAGGLEFGAAAARVVFLTAAALLGESIGSRRAYIHEIEEKALRLEREQEIEAARATAEEQARIARELHDVVAHALSVIVVQAGAADDAFDRDPHAARSSIRAIDESARSALTDLRRVLGILHDDGPDYEPQAGLERLDWLVESVRATGLAVSLEIEGPERPLPPSVEMSAYRIVQEALTNSLKHAKAEKVRIRIRYGDTLEVDVRDDGRGATNGAAAPGRGLIGMRERVTLLGGTLTAGPDAGGGYRVQADIPIEVGP
jgi:signal transduction histidine kinase